MSKGSDPASSTSQESLPHSSNIDQAQPPAKVPSVSSSVTKPAASTNVATKKEV